MAKPIDTLRQVETEQATKEGRKVLLATAQEEVQKLTDNQRASIAIKLRQDALHNAPKNPEELWNAIRILHGMEIPYTSCSDWTVSPFEWFCAVYFGWVTSSVALAGRGGSKTMLASIMNWMWGTFSPGCQSRHAAAIKEQAKVASDYLRGYKKDKVLGSVFEKNAVNTYDVRWLNGSDWRIVTGSMSGVSGQHPAKLTLDEIEFWDIAAIEQTFDVPVNRGEHKKIWAGFSTRQRSFGAMNWLVEEAPKRGIPLYSWNVFETMQRCKTCIAKDQHPHGSDKERQSVCNLWEDCHGEKATKATGWRTLEEAQEIKQHHSLHQWKVQQLCEKPSDSGLVLHNFEHEYAPVGNYTTRNYDPSREWYAIHDPAEGRMSALYFIQIYEEEGITVCFDELIQPQCPDVTATKDAFYVKCVLNGYGDPAAVIVDPHKTDAMATWKAGSEFGEGMGRRYKSLTPKMDKKSGGQEIHRTIEFLRRAICNGAGIRTFFVNPKNCPGLIRGIKEYHYPTGTNGEILSDTPDKEYSDYIDPLRYWFMFREQLQKHKNTKIRVL